MQRKGNHSRRGLSTIVTSAILLSSVTLLGSSVVVWENSNFSGRQRELNDLYSTKVDKIHENITFEKIWFGKAKSINITMTNQGPVGITLTQVQFSTGSGTFNVPVNNKQILPNKIGSLNITSYPYLDNIPTNVVVATSRGATFSTEVFTP